MVSKIYTTKSAAETQHLAENFANTLKGGETICLFGELGSGKTTFAQGLARGLGIEKRIVSPTFILMRQYSTHNPSTRNPLTFYHLDCYRLENEKDAKILGLEEIFNDSENIICIEWADRIKTLLPEKRIDIYFENIGDDIREIIFKYPVIARNPFDRLRTTKQSVL